MDNAALIYLTCALMKMAEWERSPWMTLFEVTILELGAELRGCRGWRVGRALLFGVRNGHWGIRDKWTAKGRRVVRRYLPPEDWVSEIWITWREKMHGHTCSLFSVWVVCWFKISIFPYACVVIPAFAWSIRTQWALVCIPVWSLPVWDYRNRT